VELSERPPHGHRQAVAWPWPFLHGHIVGSLHDHPEIDHQAPPIPLGFGDLPDVASASLNSQCFGNRAARWTIARGVSKPLRLTSSEDLFVSSRMFGNPCR